MYKGHTVIDADSHIREYWDFDRTYREYIDPAYRDKYEHLSEAVKARQLHPGDVGVSDLLWPRPPGHPLGVYDAFDAPRPEANGAPNRAISNAGKKVDPACHWDPSIRLHDMDVAQVD